MYVRLCDRTEGGLAPWAPHAIAWYEYSVFHYCIVNLLSGHSLVHVNFKLNSAHNRATNRHFFGLLKRHVKTCSMLRWWMMDDAWCLMLYDALWCSMMLHAAYLFTLLPIYNLWYCCYLLHFSIASLYSQYLIPTWSIVYHLDSWLLPQSFNHPKTI
jgi:hypothetical protein